MLDVLMASRGDWATPCTYCGRTIINLRLMPAQYLVERFGHMRVRIAVNGRRYTHLVATADHYFDRCYGGHSALNNILPACSPCNNARSWGRQWPLCIDCGARRQLVTKRCAPCQLAVEIREAEMMRKRTHKGGGT